MVCGPTALKIYTTKTKLPGTLRRRMLPTYPSQRKNGAAGPLGEALLQKGTTSHLAGATSHLAEAHPAKIGATSLHQGTTRRETPPAMLAVYCQQRSDAQSPSTSPRPQCPLTGPIGSNVSATTVSLDRPVKKNVAPYTNQHLHLSLLDRFAKNDLSVCVNNVNWPP